MSEQSHPDSKKSLMSRREFIPLTLGVSAFGLSALVEADDGDGGDDGNQSLCLQTNFEYQPEVDVPIRPGLGVVVIGASSGMGAELARQYADHGAYVVLAARREDRLNAVADDVTARGGTPHVVVTDVRNEADCAALVSQSIDWLSSQGKVINVVALAAVRVQAGTFGPHLSNDVFRNVIETNYLGLANCLRLAMPHLKENNSTVFYFNSVSSTVGFATEIGYTACTHAWQGMMHVLKFENPAMNFVSSQFTAVDTESWEKELTCFNDDKRFCPSTARTYLGVPDTHANWYTESFAVHKAINAIESGAESAFLSHLNKGCWLIGPMRQDLGWYLTVLESLEGHQGVQQAEAAVGELLQQPGSLRQLFGKLRQDPLTELTETAHILTSVDLQVALVLAGLEEVLPAEVIIATRQTVQAHHAAYADGSYEQLLIALSSGELSPPGIADDLDGLAPIMDCAPAEIPG